MSLTRSRIKTPRPKTGRTRKIKNEQVSYNQLVKKINNMWILKNVENKIIGKKLK